AVATIRDHAEELTALDQAIGDGDHGLNMKRGFDAVAEGLGGLAALPLSEALQKGGMTLVLKVGGASGPLCGSLVMATGQAGTGGVVMAGVRGVTGARARLERVAPMLAEGVPAVKKRSKSDAGEKTMLDVLVPVNDALHEAASRPVAVASLVSDLRKAADAG